MQFDPDLPAHEPVTKAPKTSSSTTATEESKDQERQTRRVEEIELYDEDEPTAEGEEDDDAYDWIYATPNKAEALLSEAEMRRRGGYKEGG